MFAALVFCVVASGRAHAYPLPPAVLPDITVSLSIYDLGTVPTKTTLGNLVEPDPQTGGSTTGEAYAYGGIDPSIGASIVSTYTGPVPFGAPEGGASASLTYDFMICGPKGKDVPVVFGATGGGFSTSPSGTEIETLLLTDLGVDLQAGYEYADPSLPSSFSVNEILWIPADTLETASLSAGAGLSTPFGGSVSAFIDPTFKIDSSFPQASEYSIEFSPNLESVPEQPSTIMLLTLGTGTLLILPRNRTVRPKGPSLV